MGGTPLASPPGVDSSLGDELSKGPYAISGWSDLPSDLLLSILQRLELPQALAFAAVCRSWCSAAMVAGVPRSCRTWLLSWADFIEERESLVSSQKKKCQDKSETHIKFPAATCKFRHLLDTDKAYEVNFPKGCFVACCGASHGWLVLVNDLSNLVLFNPFSSAMVPLPPITDFACVEAIYGSKGNLECYRFADRVHAVNSLGTWFYQKAVLSCSPSRGDDYIVMIIHRDSYWLSFLRAGQSKWQVASSLDVRKPYGYPDGYADCAYHKGMFYSVTLHGIVEKWDLDGPNGPTKEVIIAKRHHTPVLTRHLVATPWGDLLRVSVFYANRYPGNVRFQIRKVDPEGCKEVSRDFTEHAIFIGLNHSACLPTKNFPGLRPSFIYFSAPCLTRAICSTGRIGDCRGVRAYDLKRRTFKPVFPFGGMRDTLSMIFPSEVWITPNM